MKSVKDISIETGVSVQTVYRVLNKVKAMENEVLTEKVGGTAYFTAYGEEVILTCLTGVKQTLNSVKQAESGKTTVFTEKGEKMILTCLTPVKHVKAGETLSDGQSANGENSPADSMTDTLVNMLKDELSAKNKLIDEQQQTIKELSETIKIQAQSINTARQNELAETIIDGKELLTVPTPSKPSLWSKLFKRGK